MTGLLLIGAAAEKEGLFAAVAQRLRGDALGVLASLLAVDALITAVMNLDTAVAFMTPIMIHAGRQLADDEAPFLYGAVFMANAASLYLPGSNLTNLLVVGHGTSGAAFLADHWAPAVIATAVTAAGVLAWGARVRSGRFAIAVPEPWRPGPSTAAVVVAAVLVVALREPALPVLALGVVVGAVVLERRALVDAVGPLSLAGLFALAVAVGTLARAIDLTLEAGRWATAGIAAGTSVAINNLPAATLLSAQAPEHARALLIGLNLGPNLAVTGSLSALIWWRAARRLGAQPSARTYTRIGAPLALVAILGATFSLSG